MYLECERWAKDEGWKCTEGFHALLREGIWILYNEACQLKTYWPCRVRKKETSRIIPRWVNVLVMV